MTYYVLRIWASDTPDVVGQFDTRDEAVSAAISYTSVTGNRHEIVKLVERTFRETITESVVGP